MRIRFNPDGEGLETIFGSLECAVLDLLWEEAGEGGWTNKHIHRELHKKGCSRGLTTVATVTRRMAKKKVLREVREANGAFVYSVAVSRDNLVDAVISRVLGRLLMEWPGQLQAFISLEEELVKRHSTQQQ